MFEHLKAFIHHGNRYIPDPTKSVLPAIHTGKPVISADNCEINCQQCAEICPSKAIDKNPVSIELHKCVFCLECQFVCPINKIKFTNDLRISSNVVEKLKIVEGNNNSIEFDAEKIRKDVVRKIGRALRLRLVSAGSCNGCELELGASGNVNFDMGRYGIEFLASPRHCDGLVITGPITQNSLDSVLLTYKAIAEPKIVILVGSCATGGGLFENSPALTRQIIEQLKPDLYIPGCPIHPLTFINGILDFLKAGK